MCRGFSLIELLVTVAVVVILVAIVIPLVGFSRESALHVKNASNLRSIGTAFLSYAVDNNGTLPLTSLGTGFRSQTYYGMGATTGVFKVIGDRFQPGSLTPEGEGYVESADVFYGPFTPLFNEKRSPAPSGFYEFRANSMYLGYAFYSLPVQDAGVGSDYRAGVGPVNESIQTGDPLAPLASDLMSAAILETTGGRIQKVTAVHLNGSISVFPPEIHSLGSNDRIRYIANWKGEYR